MCPCIVDIVGPRPHRPQSPPPGQRGKGLFEQMIPEIMTPLKTVYQQHISKINTEAKRFSGASHLGKVQEYSEIGQVGRRGGGDKIPPVFHSFYGQDYTYRHITSLSPSIPSMQGEILSVRESAAPCGNTGCSGFLSQTILR